MINLQTSELRLIKWWGRQICRLRCFKWWVWQITEQLKILEPWFKPKCEACTSNYWWLDTKISVRLGLKNIDDMTHSLSCDMDSQKSVSLPLTNGFNIYGLMSVINLQIQALRCIDWWAWQMFRSPNWDGFIWKCDEFLSPKTQMD